MDFSFYNQTPQHFPGAAPVNLVQTNEFDSLLKTAAEHGDVGFFNASAALFARHPGLLVDEEVVLVTGVTSSVAVAWDEQLQDWLIPFNETDARGGPVRTMLSFGNGPLASESPQIESMLELVVEWSILSWLTFCPTVSG